MPKEHSFAKWQAMLLGKLLAGSPGLMTNQYVLVSLPHRNSEHL